jgi:hypothetical protein
MDDRHAVVDWGRKAIDAARRSGTKRRPNRGAKTSKGGSRKGHLAQ